MVNAKPTQEEKERVIGEAMNFVEIYKAGFVDGHKAAIGETKPWKKIQKLCFKTFSLRFLKHKTK